METESPIQDEIEMEVSLPEVESPEVFDETVPDEKSEVEGDYKFSSIEEVKETLDEGQWEKKAESSGGDYLKLETKEWVYRDGSGQEASVTAQVTGELKSRHQQIVEDLFAQGFAVVEYSRDDQMVREVYHADERGHISYEIYEMSREQIQETTEILSDPELITNSDLDADSSSMDTTPQSELGIRIQFMETAASVEIAVDLETDEDQSNPVEVQPIALVQAEAVYQVEIAEKTSQQVLPEVPTSLFEIQTETQANEEVVELADVINDSESPIELVAVETPAPEELNHEHNRVRVMAEKIEAESGFKSIERIAREETAQEDEPIILETEVLIREQGAEQTETIVDIPATEYIVHQRIVLPEAVRQEIFAEPVAEVVRVVETQKAEALVVGSQSPVEAKAQTPVVVEPQIESVKIEPIAIAEIPELFESEVQEITQGIDTIAETEVAPQFEVASERVEVAASEQPVVFLETKEIPAIVEVDQEFQEAVVEVRTFEPARQIVVEKVDQVEKQSAVELIEQTEKLEGFTLKQFESPKISETKPKPVETTRIIENTAVVRFDENSETTEKVVLFRANETTEDVPTSSSRIEVVDTTSPIEARISSASAVVVADEAEEDTERDDIQVVELMAA